MEHGKVGCGVEVDPLLEENPARLEALLRGLSEALLPQGLPT
jgi:hypothetical protein